MNRNLKSIFVWWLLFTASVLFLPLLPTASLLGVGWLFPDQVPWFYAEASVPIGPLAAVSAVTFLLARAKTPALLRLCTLGVVIFCMSFIARTELVFAKACVTQPGTHINFQQQQRDQEEAKGVSCD